MISKDRSVFHHLRQEHVPLGHGEEPTKAELAAPMMLMRPVEARWSAYVDNGGSCAAIAGDGYAIIASDMRLSEGYGIHSRNSTKLSQLTPTCVLGSPGMQADRSALHKNLGVRLQWYEYQNSGLKPDVRAISQMLSNTLYMRRFFPFYTFNVLAGVDAAGQGVVYSYDAVGCTQAMSYGCTGSGTQLIEALMDNQVLRSHQSKAGGPAKFSKDEALELIKDVFIAAAERDIHSGDQMEAFIITKDQTTREVIQLRRD